MKLIIALIPDPDPEASKFKMNELIHSDLHTTTGDLYLR